MKIFYGETHYTDLGPGVLISGPFPEGSKDDLPLSSINPDTKAKCKANNIGTAILNLVLYLSLGEKNKL